MQFFSFPWVRNNKIFDVVQDGFQCLTIPRSGRYKFEVIGASWYQEEPGARIIGVVRLEKGQKVTVALGQRGNDEYCGHGGTFVVKKNGTSDPEPLFVAAGAGSAYSVCNYNFSKASLTQAASENNKIGSSGVQQLFASDRNDIFCCGAGFSEEQVIGELRENSVAPKSYKNGLIGGKGIHESGDLVEGGFGGGGACYYKNDHTYLGGGGGYTGGGSKILNDEICEGGGGGSFSIDEVAQFDHVREYEGKCKITFLD